MRIFIYIMKLNMILITDVDYGISKNNKIPWYFTEDLKYFNKITTNNICIMGSTTAKDLGKPLKNRINIVISSNDECKDFIITRSFEESLKEAKKHIYGDKEIFIIGGSRLYNEALKSNLVNKIYYNQINKSFGCDNFVEPLLNRADFTYEIIDKKIYDQVNIIQSIEILENVELTFYLMTKK